MPIIGAIVCNAHQPEPEVEFEVVHEGVDGEWFTNDGHRVWPFAIHATEFECKIPEGWIEYLFKEASRFAANRPAPSESSVDAKSLLASLGLPTTTHNSMSGKLVRRV